jgi:hypothetical protein
MRPAVVQLESAAGNMPKRMCVAAANGDFDGETRKTLAVFRKNTHKQRNPGNG